MKIKTIVFLSMLLTLALPVTAQNQPKAPMHGTYSIGVGKDYVTLSAAMINLHHNGADDTVIFEITNTYNPANETFPVPVLNFDGASNKSPLIVKPASDFSTPIEANAKALFAVHKSSYVIFDGSANGDSNRNLVLINNSTADSTGVFAIDSSSHITIKNCLMKGGGSNSISSGITTNAVDSVYFENNKISKAQIGIVVNGSNAIISGNEIGSSITDEYLDFGICVRHGNNAIIDSNKIFGIIDDSVYKNNNALHAISLLDMTGNVLVSKNFIDSVIFTGDNNIVQAIAIKRCNTSSLIVSNNRISHIASNAYSDKVPCAIAVSSPDLTTLQILSNSIDMPANSQYGLGGSDNYILAVAFAIDSGSNVVFKNNVISNALGNRTGATNITLGAAISYITPTIPFSEIDNNVYYTGGNYTLKGVVINTSGVLDLATWQSLSGQDSSSIAQENVCFSSDNDLHLKACSPAIGRAEYIPFINTDIENTPRNKNYTSCGAYTYNIQQASNISINSTSKTSFNINWIQGTGNKEVVFYKNRDAINQIPPTSNGITYNVNDTVGGWICAYNGVHPSSISINTDSGIITVMVQEYFGSPGNEIYITDTASGNPLSNETTYIEDFNIDNTLIYPNPANDYIKINKPTIQKVEIYDTRGRLIKVSNYKNNFLDIKELPSGFYGVKVYTKNKIFVSKLIVNK